MTEPFASLSDPQLLAELSREIDTLCLLPPPDQRRLLAMARGLDSEGMGRQFVIAGVRSSAAVLADLADTEADSVLARPEVRRFIEENVVPSGRARSAVFPGNDVKRLERERLVLKTVAAIREARRSRGRHEIKKTRNVLMKIDQRALRQRLGQEGEELCREIRTILRTMAPMF
jgi:hypothetical protein